MEESTQYVMYEDFGAVGDGHTDDMPAIIAAHNRANALGRPVRGTPGKTYYLRSLGPAIVKTNCYWQGCTFIIDDQNNDVVKGNPLSPIFEVQADTNGSWSDGSQGVILPMRKGVQTNYKNALLILFDHSQKQFIRFGDCANSGGALCEVLTTDENGCLESDPANHFNRVDDKEVHYTNETPIDINGGTFIHWPNLGPSVYKYHHRGIRIIRSNTTVHDITFKIERQGTEGAPYAAFIQAVGCRNIVIRDCTIQARRWYNSMGTYVFQLNHCVDVLLQNIKQTNIEDNMAWGPIATNYCVNFHIQNCELGRFDAHCGIRNLYISNSRFGWQGIKFVGWGDCYIEDCELDSNTFVVLRYDYGAFWNGDIHITRCTWHTNTLAVPTIISILNYGLHDFGQPCMGPTNVYIDSLYVPDEIEKVYVFSDYLDGETDEDVIYPYIPPKRVVVKNCREGLVELCPVKNRYTDTEIMYKK